MDEAERCHELAYISYGRLLAQGTVQQVIDAAKLKTWAFSGPGLGGLAQRLRAAPGVRTVAPFGAALHVSAHDEAALRAACAALGDACAGLTITPVEPRLEDVFIYLMQSAEDNFGRNGNGNGNGKGTPAPAGTAA